MYVKQNGGTAQQQGEKAAEWLNLRETLVSKFFRSHLSSLLKPGITYITFSPAYYVTYLPTFYIGSCGLKCRTT